jgi:hypothetical protein
MNPNKTMDALSQKTELQLINIATFARSEKRASRAMKILREKYDPTYDWDLDMDGLANTAKHREVMQDKFYDYLKDLI